MVLFLAVACRQIRLCHAFVMQTSITVINKSSSLISNVRVRVLCMGGRMCVCVCVGVHAESLEICTTPANFDVVFPSLGAGHD